VLKFATLLFSHQASLKKILAISDSSKLLCMTFFGIFFAPMISAFRRREVNMGLLDGMGKGLLGKVLGGGSSQ